jgi:hypothetical protein
MGLLATEGQGRKHANASAPAATPQAALPRLPWNNHKPIMLPTIMLARRPKIQIAIVLMARAWAFPSNHRCGVNGDHRGVGRPLFPPLLCRKELESPVLVRADPHAGRRSLTGAGNSGLGDSACITLPFGRKLRVRSARDSGPIWEKCAGQMTGVCTRLNMASKNSPRHPVWANRESPSSLVPWSRGMTRASVPRVPEGRFFSGKCSIARKNGLMRYGNCFGKSLTATASPTGQMTSARSRSMSCLASSGRSTNTIGLKRPPQSVWVSRTAFRKESRSSEWIAQAIRSGR